MEVLSALFNAISDRLTGSAWFHYVQWPFWVFVILIALGGVYTACFQKNTLFCRGVTGALKLTLVYLCYYGIYRLAPNALDFVEEFPFLNITKDTLTLVNPLPLLTACGNGRGGGDYHDCYPDYDKVGTWAFDIIECTDARPEGYEKYEPCFTEQREAA